MTSSKAFDLGWNTAIKSVLAIAEQAAKRIPASPHNDFAIAVLVQLAHDGRHLLIGDEPPAPMAALPALEMKAPAPSVKALEPAA